MRGGRSAALHGILKITLRWDSKKYKREMVGEMQEEHEQSQTQGETVGEKTELTIERTGREHTAKQETEDTSFLSAVSMPIVAITALARPNQAL